MKSLQDVLQIQLKETADKAEKQQATVSVFLFCILCCGAGKLLNFFPKLLWNKYTMRKENENATKKMQSPRS